MKSQPSLILFAVILAGCQTPLGKELVRLQNNPVVRNAETTGITIGLDLATGSPAFGFIAPIAVNGLTAGVNALGKPNPTAVTGNPITDAALITTAVSEAVPTTAGASAAAAIAGTYKSAMASLPKNSTSANAVLSAIAAGLTRGANSAPSACLHHYFLRNLDLSPCSLEPLLNPAPFSLRFRNQLPTDPADAGPHSFRRDEERIQQPV